MQHTPSETLGTIEDVLKGEHIRFDYIETFAGKAVPGEMADKVVFNRWASML